MPIQTPPLDTRTWQELRDQLVARIPTHTPEWTNYNASDPGVTLLELFAFLGESILYRANRIPERNRLAFLQLLGLPLLPGTPARALVFFRVPTLPKPQTTTLATDLEVRAGKIAFHLDAGLDVLPVEGAVYSKVKVAATTEQLDAYARIYAAVKKSASTQLSLYASTPLDATGIRLGSTVETIDGCAWIALLKDKNSKNTTLDEVRAAMAGRVLNLGMAMEPAATGRDLLVGSSEEESPGIQVDLCVGSGPTPTWQPLGTVRGCLERTGVVSLTLPALASQMKAWSPPDVMSDGVGDTPPALADSTLEERLVVWLRIKPVGQPDVRLNWLGINATMATQGDRVYGEVVATGNGNPDQRYSLALVPVVEGSLTVWVDGEAWALTSLIGNAPREGAEGAKVVQVDWEAGTLLFGNGLAGERPKRGSIIKASYAQCAGAAGNVGPGAINQFAASINLKVENPVAALGGTAAETVAQGEAQVARFLQHRERLVTVEDFQVIVARTPGVVLARVEVLPAFHPLAGTNTPGDAPGCVTVMVVPPSFAPGVPPVPTDAVLSAVCDYLEPRRLVTTEICLRGPSYVDLLVAVGVELKPLLPGSSPAEVLSAIRQALLDALSPVPAGSNATGWPLARPVRANELFVVVAGVAGVKSVTALSLGTVSGSTVITADSVALVGLQLPWLSAISVVEGPPLPLSQLLPTTSSGSTTTVTTLPLPVVPDECR